MPVNPAPTFFAFRGRNDIDFLAVPAQNWNSKFYRYRRKRRHSTSNFGKGLTSSELRVLALYCRYETLSFSRDGKNDIWLYAWYGFESRLSQETCSGTTAAIYRESSTIDWRTFRMKSTWALICWFNSAMHEHRAGYILMPLMPMGYANRFPRTRFDYRSGWSASPTLNSEGSCPTVFFLKW